MKSFAVAALRAGEFDAFRPGVRERANLRVADIANRSCRTRWRTAAARWSWTVSRQATGDRSIFSSVRRL